MCLFSTKSIQNMEEIALQLPGSDSKMLSEINERSGSSTARHVWVVFFFPLFSGYLDKILDI